MGKTLEIKSFLESIEEEYGDDIFARDGVGEFISTGCLSLDVSMGTGGIPVGRFTEIYGAEAAGKTTIALSVSRNAIKSGKKVLYLDAENMLDYFLVQQMTGEVFPDDKFVLLQPETAEDALTIIEKAIEAKEFGLIVLDSIASMSSDTEKEKELEDQQMGGISKLLTKFFRRNVYAVRNSNTAVLLLNQVRDNIGAYAKGYTVPGGHALKHFSSVIIALSKGQEISENSKPIGVTTTFVVKKNKLASPFRGYTVPIIFGSGLDFYKDFVGFTEDIGVLQKAGPYYKYHDSALGKGVNATIEFLKLHPEIVDNITAEVYNNISAVKIETGEVDTLDKNE